MPSMIPPNLDTNDLCQLRNWLEGARHQDGPWSNCNTCQARIALEDLDWYLGRIRQEQAARELLAWPLTKGAKTE